jgi:hypothetical protein
VKVFRTSGHAYLVCPRLLELDERHGVHRSRWPKLAPGRHPWDDPEHEAFLEDSEGHLAADFYWWPGHLPLVEAEWPVCDCGRRLVHADLDDPHDRRHLAEVEET